METHWLVWLMNWMLLCRFYELWLSRDVFCKCRGAASVCAGTEGRNMGLSTASPCGNRSGHTRYRASVFFFPSTNVFCHSLSLHQWSIFRISFIYHRRRVLLAVDTVKWNASLCAYPKTDGSNLCLVNVLSSILLFRRIRKEMAKSDC